MDPLVRAGATIYTTPSDTEIVGRRIFDAPRELVFDAWTSCEHIPHWMLGPGGWTMPVCEIDLRVGGRWHFVWRRDDGSEMEMDGDYREISRPERLVTTERWGGDWPEAVSILVLTEDDEGRTLMTLTMRYESEDVRDRAVGTGMTEGMDRSFERLDERLAAGG